MCIGIAPAPVSEGDGDTAGDAIADCRDIDRRAVLEGDRHRRPALGQHDLLDQPRALDRDRIAIRIDAVRKDYPTDATFSFEDSVCDLGPLRRRHLECSNGGGDARAVIRGNERHDVGREFLRTRRRRSDF